MSEENRSAYAVFDRAHQAHFLPVLASHLTHKVNNSKHIFILRIKKAHAH